MTRPKKSTEPIDSRNSAEIHSERVLSALKRSRLGHLVGRAKAAHSEGGLSLFARRFHRWIQHEWDRRFPSKSYQRWLGENHIPSEEAAKQTDWAENASSRTLISLVCPLHQTPLPVLKQTIQSVLGQTYPYWELCLTLCDDESQELKDDLDRQTQQDERIQVIQVNSNRGISVNTNAAIAAAKGEWIGFLDHDDLLSQDALYTVATHLDANPNCDLLYSDEDLISADGKIRRSPILKPDWSPEMLLHFNYICHFVVARAALIERLGGLRSCYDGAQDWDFLVRAGEQTQRIDHLPRILYHWRESETSTAAGGDAKPYVVDAQQRVLKDCFRRRGIDANIDRARFGHYRPDWEIRDSPLVSIVIPTRDQLELIRQLIDGILHNTQYSNIEIVIVDNGSTNRSTLDFYSELRRRNDIRIIDYREPFNYSVACNRGAAAARGEYVLFMNNDIEITHPGWLNEMLKWGEQPEIGVVGPHLIYPNGRTQHAGIVLGLYGLAGHAFHQCAPETYSPFGMAEWVRNVSAVTGACQLISKSLFDDLGGYDEGYTLLYSDLDLCLRVKQKGFRVVYTPHCRLVHHECSTRNAKREHQDDERRFARMLIDNALISDPYYHPALSATAVAPQLKPKQALNTIDNLQSLLSDAHPPNGDQKVRAPAA